MESVLGVVTAVTSESIGAVVSVSPSDSSVSSVPPSIPSLHLNQAGVHHFISNLTSASCQYDLTLKPRSFSGLGES